MSTNWTPEKLSAAQVSMKRRWTGKMQDYLHLKPGKKRTFLALQLFGSWSDEYRAEQDKEREACQ